VTDIIDIAEERQRRDRPDPEHVRCDDFGREMYEFGLNYEFDGDSWTVSLWAYDADDAHSRVSAMKRTLTCFGQIFTVITND
jgi:hypothetical protein